MKTINFYAFGTFILTLALTPALLAKGKINNIQSTGSLKTNGCSYFFPKNMYSEKIEDRVAKIIKKNGDEIHILGETHAMPFSDDEITDEALGKDFPNDKLEVILNKFYETNVDVIKYLKDNVKFLSQIHTYDTNYLAVEANDEDVKYLMQNSSEQLTLLKDKIDGTTFTKKKKDELTMLIFNDWLYVYRKSPKKFKNIKIIGLDMSSNKIIKPLRSYFKTTESFDKKVKEIAPKAHNDFSKLNSMLFSGINNNISVGRAFKLFSSKFPKTLHKDLKKYIKVARKMSIINYKRDKLMSKKLIKQKGNGVLIIGALHTVTLGEHIMRRCQ